MRGTRAGVGAVMLAIASVAMAHVHLKQSEPADGAVVHAAPAQIVLTFTEPALVTALWIQPASDASAGQAGARQKLGPLPAGAAATVTVPTPGLKPGKYVVTWRAVSPDQHVMTGQLRFTVG